MRLLNKAVMVATIAAAFVAVNPMARADDGTTLEISIKDHQFQPAEIKAAAGKPIVFKVKNLGTEPIEFESETLQVESVIKPSAEGTVKVKAQKPGRYVFFDDLHTETKGTLVVE
jgi:plastocyanin